MLAKVEEMIEGLLPALIPAALRDQKLYRAESQEKKWVVTTPATIPPTPIITPYAAIPDFKRPTSTLIVTGDTSPFCD